MNNLLKDEELISLKQNFYTSEYINAIKKYIYQIQDENDITKYTIKKRTALIFLLIYLTQLDLEDILNLQVNDLKNILENKYSLINVDNPNKRTFVVLLNSCICIKEFSFLYNKILKLKKPNHLLFSSTFNYTQKLRKKNVLITLESFCLELQREQVILFNLNLFLK